MGQLVLGLFFYNLFYVPSTAQGHIRANHTSKATPGQVETHVTQNTNTKLAQSSAVKAQAQCESRGGRPGLPVPNSSYGLFEEEEEEEELNT